MSAEPIADSVTRRPAPGLQPFIERYVAYRLEGFEAGIHRGLPSRFLTLVISTSEPIDVIGMPNPEQAPGSFGAVLSGLQPTPAFIRHNGNQVGVAVEVTPLGARTLFGMPAGAIACTTLELADVLGSRAAALPERLAGERTWAARFAILDEVFTRSLNEGTEAPSEVAFAWNRLVATAGRVSIRALSDEVGWSRRHFGDRFRTEVGLAPKVAARMLRFERTRRVLGRPERPGLAELAIACGYFDQAHLTRDWNQFAGCSPTQWLAEELPFVQDGLAAPVAD